MNAPLPAGVKTARTIAELQFRPGQPGRWFPMRRDSNGQIELLLLWQPTGGSEKGIYSVADALGGNVNTQIGVARANRINPHQEDKCGCRTPQPIAPEKCTLCGAAQQARSEGEPKPMYIKDNPRPFGPLLHKVVFSDRHIEFARDIGLNEVVGAWEQFYELVTQADPELDGLTVGMNNGAYVLCGASQIHFHYQVAGLGSANINSGDSLGEICQDYRSCNAGAEYLTDYEKGLLHAGLVIEQNEHAILFVPIAQRFKHELQVMARDPRVGNLGDTTLETRTAMAILEHRAIQIYAKLGLQSFNEVWHMTRFSAKNDWGQRLIVSLCPRNSIIAFYELSHNYVVDQLPWDSAKELRAGLAQVKSVASAWKC